ALIQSVDAIEVYNSRTDKLKNCKALALAKEYNKKKIAGSDAHFTQEIGLTMMEFKGNDLKDAIINSGGEIIKAEESPAFYPPISGIVNLYKTKNLYLFLKWIKKLGQLVIKR
ncbi:MAG: PHP domain-containing protein, partial [Candidatus Stahlbacteria bacterium]|nr:PHP domain-containing protein [Candidatus Stahlbacteria bacterium]